MKFKILLMSLLMVFMFACNDDESVDPVLTTINITEDITQNELWKSGNTYIINGNIKVSADIIIEPGTIIKFKEGAELYIAYWENDYATIKAKGTPEKPILFTSASPHPAAGDYGGVSFFSGANLCEFEHCIFEYAGKYDYSGAIYIDNTTVSFSNCEFRHIKNDGIKLEEEGAFGNFSNNVFTGVQYHPVTIYPQSVHTIGTGNVFNAQPGLGILIEYNVDAFQTPGNYSWLAHDAPYVIKGNLKIGSENGSVNLTIAPGAVLQFSQEGGLSFAYWSGTYAKFTAEGTPDKPIIFTSNNPYPAKGDWQGLYFNAGVNGSSLKNCEILYAGRDEYYGAMLLYETGNNAVSIANSRIAYSKSHGIVVYNSSIDYSSVTFDNNDGANYYEN